MNDFCRLNGNRLELMYDSFTLHLYGYGAGILRAVCVPAGGALEENPKLALVQAQPGAAPLVEKNSGPDGTVVITHGDLRVEACKKSGRLRFYRGGSWMLDWEGASFTEKPEYQYGWEGGKPEYTTTGGGTWAGFPRLHVHNWAARECGTTYEAGLRLKTEKDEPIYGLGQHEKGLLNYRGTTQYLYHTLMKTPMPFFATPKAVGVLFDCGCLMKVESGSEAIDVTLDSAGQLDVYFLLNQSFDGLEESLAHLTGRPAMLPLWMFGYVFSKERFHTQQELVETAQRFRSEGVPCDALVQDWKTWTDPYWGSKELDETRWPNLGAAVDRLHQLNLKFMMAVWPGCFPGSRSHTEMDEAGYLLGDYIAYDAFNEDARTLFFEQCRRQLLAAGTDAWWADASEPFQDFEPSREALLDDETRSEAIGGAHKRFLGSRRANLYSLHHCGGLYENTRKAVPAKRAAILTRSVYPGEQRYGVVHWSGDISATWGNYRAQLAELLNMSLCGMPYVCEDIGGFAVRRKNPPVWSWAGDFDKGVEDPGYRELYVRWMQNGAFLPVFRSHGTDTPREPWFFENVPGAPFYDALLAAINMRYRFLPYVYSLAGAAHLHGHSIMRSLLFDYPDDGQARTIADEYMFGPGLLVCPVFEPFYYAPGGEKLAAPHKRPCWLPGGPGFYALATGTFFAGGQMVEADAPLETIPLFAPAGAILPMARGRMQSTADYRPDELDLAVYAGADGTFTLYMDAGDGYDYEKGEAGGYALLPIVWQENDQTLRFAPRSGCYAGMAQNQRFHITLHTPQGAYTRTVAYNGGEITVEFKQIT